MRVVTLVLATSTGGVGTHVASLVRGLGAAGWQVRVCGPRATDELFGFSRAGAAFTPVRVRAGDPVAVAAVRRAAAGSDVVHAHGLRAATVAGLAGRRPLVVTWHNAILSETGLGGTGRSETVLGETGPGGTGLGGTGPGAAAVGPETATAAARRRVLALGERYVARVADIALCVSPDLEARVRALGGRAVRPGPVAAPSREPERFPSEVRAELGVGEAPLLLSVGRLHPQKGHDTFVEAVTLVRQRCPGVRAVIAGDGPQRAELEALIGERQAPVVLLGRRIDIPDLLRAADVLVWASVWEGSPLSVQEALRAGRPLVATRVGGVPGIVGDGGVLVPPGDPVALAEQIGRVLADPAWASTLAARAAEVARRLPGEHDTVAQVQAVYHELTGAPH